MKQSIEEQLKGYQQRHIRQPEDLSLMTYNKLLNHQTEKDEPLIPLTLVAVFLVNLLTSILLAYILYAISSLALWQWIIVGMIYTSVNGFVIGIIYATRDKIIQVMKSLN